MDYITKLETFARERKQKIHYEFPEEMLIGSVLDLPWYTYNSYSWRPYASDQVTAYMTEDEIVQGLVHAQKKWPNVVGCVHFQTLYIAILLRMPRVIHIITDWMEKRNQYYTPSGTFTKYSTTYYPSEYESINVRLDYPRLMREGMYNPPIYLQRADWESSTMNLNHDIERWVNSSELPISILHLLGRALASNPAHWENICCGSMNRYSVLPNFVGCISHCIHTEDSKPITHYVPEWYGETPTANSPFKIIWHTMRSRCTMCPVEPHETFDPAYYIRFRLPSNVILPFPIVPYEIVIAHAVNVRRRKFRGVLWCASVLLGRARLLPYRPGGTRYKDGLIRWKRSIKAD